MIQFKKIICPIDFSKSSRRILETAYTLAQQFGSKLLLVHVVPPIPTLGPPPEFSMPDPTAFNIEAYQKELREAAGKELEKMIKMGRESGVRVETTVKLGNPAEGIMRLSQDKKADLIIISTHGKTGLLSRLFGSVTETVVRHSPCPVLLLPPPRKAEPSAKAH